MASAGQRPVDRDRFRENLSKYAQVIVEVGGTVRPGQFVLVYASIEHRELVHEITERAYAVGARRVDVYYADPMVDHITTRDAPADSLDWSAPWLVERLRWLGENDGITIGLVSGPANDDSVPIERRARFSMPAVKAEYLRLLNAGLMNRVSATCATESWAKTIYGNGAIEPLWDALFRINRVDDDDPVQSWRDHLTRLDERARHLTEAHYRAIQFDGPGTSLNVGLVPQSHWRPVRYRTRRGDMQVGNLPTEEVLTVPDRGNVNGYVRATRPGVIDNVVVSGVELEFRQGTVIASHAESGGAALQRLLAVDEGAQMLGEVALVDGSSRVAREDTMFFATVIDENATSHIALGQAYLDTVEGGREMSEDERFRAGINDSNTHWDLMIGGEGIDVFGIAENGESVPLIINDRWVISSHENAG